MVEERKLTAKIVFEEPAKADAFEGRGHARSSEALADAIVQLSSRDGAIGLEGPWGSGKSTVIGFASDVLTKLDPSRTYHIFNFDLWTHQTDEFRRAFLEEFVSWIEARKLLPTGDLERARDEIRDKVKTVRTGTFREYSFFGAVLVLTIPFLPLAYSWTSPAAFKERATAPMVLGVDLPTLVFSRHRDRSPARSTPRAHRVAPRAGAGTGRNAPAPCAGWRQTRSPYADIDGSSQPPDSGSDYPYRKEQNRNSFDLQSARLRRLRGRGTARLGGGGGCPHTGRSTRSPLPTPSAPPSPASRGRTRLPALAQTHNFHP